MKISGATCRTAAVSPEGTDLRGIFSGGNKGPTPANLNCPGAPDWFRLGNGNTFHMLIIDC
jgi:hypothetical protein